MRTTILSLLFAFTVACGGGNPEPKTPATDNADTTAASTDTPAANDSAPSAAQDKTPDPPKSAPVKTSAVSNTADGSDIVPPFTASKDSPDTASTSSGASKDDTSQTPAPAKKKGKAKKKKKKDPNAAQ